MVTEGMLASRKTNQGKRQIAEKSCRILHKRYQNQDGVCDFINLKIEENRGYTYFLCNILVQSGGNYVICLSTG